MAKDYQKKDYKSEDNKSTKKSLMHYVDPKTNKTGCTNKPEMYMHNVQLAKDIATINYSNVAGLPIELLRDSSASFGPDVQIPGIMLIELMPSIGVTAYGSDEVNNASRLLYSFVRHANSGSRNYEQADLMTYILAGGSLFSCYSEMVRLYGLLNVYSKYNRYLGKAIVTALGYDYDDMVKHISDLRAFINTYAVKVNSFAFPAKMDYYNVMIANPGFVYQDSGDKKSQFYLKQYRCLWEWTPYKPDGVTAASSLRPILTPWASATPTTFNDLVVFANSLVAAMMTNEDVGIMSGDILKAFGDSGLLSIQAISENYATMPVYDEYALAQIHNLTVCGLPRKLEDFWVTQTGNVLIFKPVFQITGEPDTQFTEKMNAFIDSGMDSPTPEFNLEATRLVVPMTTETTSGGTYLVPLWTGTDMVTTLRVFTIDLTDGSAEPGQMITSSTYYSPSVDPDRLQHALVALRPFDWSPIFYVVDGNERLHVAGEVFNYTILSPRDIGKLHTTCLLSVLDVSGTSAIAYKG